METGDKYLGVTKSHTWKSFNRKINAKDIELFGKGSVHKFYRLNALITLEHVNTTDQKSKKRRIFNEQNFKGVAM